MFIPENLSTMDIQFKQTMEQFLEQVTRWGGDYYLESGYIENRRVQIGTRLVFVGDDAPPPTDYVYASYSILLDWENRAIVVPWTWHPQGPTFKFGDSVLEWYRQNRRLNDHQIREIIGGKLYQRFQRGGDNTDFDVEALAHELGSPVVRVRSQADVLVRLGYAVEPPRSRIWSPGGAPPPPIPPYILHRFQLTTEGHRWAAVQFPPETMGWGPNVTVHVDVHIAVSNVIEQSRRSEVDEETKKIFELYMRRIEEELRKPEGEGSIQPVKDALEVANNAKGLLGPHVTFMSQNWDKIERLGGMMF